MHHIQIRILYKFEHWFVDLKFGIYLMPKLFLSSEKTKTHLEKLFDFFCIACHFVLFFVSHFTMVMSADKWIVREICIFQNGTIRICVLHKNKNKNKNQQSKLKKRIFKNTIKIKVFYCC